MPTQFLTLMVKAADVVGRYFTESRWTRVVPLVSATIILLLGIGLTAGALADAL